MAENLNWNLREGDSNELIDDKMGLTALTCVANFGIAAGELFVAAKAAKSDLGTVTKWLAVTALGANAVSLMKNTMRMFFEQEKVYIEKEPDDEELDEEETEEKPEETEPEKVEET